MSANEQGVVKTSSLMRTNLARPDPIRCNRNEGKKASSLRNVHSTVFIERKTK